MAVRTLSEAVLGTPEGSQKEVEEAILRQDPKVLAEVKRAEQAFVVQLRELDVDLARIDAQDRASARVREQAVGGMVNPILAAVVLLASFAMFGATFMGYVTITSESAPIVYTVLGYVSAYCTQVLNYYFGSSAGSAQKAASMDKLLGASKAPSLKF